MPKASCLKVPKKLGEQAIRLVKELDLSNSELQIQQTADQLVIPLTAHPTDNILKKFEKLQTFEISVCDFDTRERRHLTVYKKY